ncbi:MAG: hypothetical protein ABJA62_00930, partial [Luteimonas sp.]
FSRFGARLDDDTRKTIEHGRRIRACLKQPEFAPVSVSEQIAILLALTARLFDDVPLDRMTDAGIAVRQSASRIPGNVRARFSGAEKPSDDDRKAIVEVARQALLPFVSKPATDANADAKRKSNSAAKPDIQPEPAEELRPEPLTENQPKPLRKEGS